MPAFPGHRACPCTSQLKYGECCAPFHRGTREAPDAEALMRSRYSAFAVRDAEYLLRTLHPDHPDRAREKSHAIAEIRRSCDEHRYPGLAILDRQEPDGDGVARVLFFARVFAGGRDRSFVELSEFAREGEGRDGNAWRYLAGEAVPREAAGAVDRLKIAGFRELVERQRRPL